MSGSLTDIDLLNVNPRAAAAAMSDFVVDRDPAAAVSSVVPNDSAATSGARGDALPAAAPPKFQHECDATGD